MQRRTKGPCERHVTVEKAVTCSADKRSELEGLWGEGLSVEGAQVPMQFLLHRPLWTERSILGAFQCLGGMKTQLRLHLHPSEMQQLSL